MKKYELNIVEYNEFLEFDNDPYPIFLNPITLDQFKEGLALTKKLNSFIRDSKQAEFLSLFFEKELDIGEDPIVIDKESTYIAIRFMGHELPEDMRFLSEDHDIEIYHISLLDKNTEVF